jgi:hypothetical protein
MNKRCSSFTLFLAVVFLLLAPSLATAQNLNGSISGTVTDPSGGVIPNAELTLKTLITGEVAKVTSGPDGLYSFQNLQPGVYNLTVSAKGFRDFEQMGIELFVNTKARVDVSLVLGSAAQTVEVQANASPLNYESPQQGGTISPETLDELPLILSGQTRNAASFARLLPGALSGGDEDHLNFNTRINGGTNEGDEGILDGISIIDGSLGQNGIELSETGHPFSPEAISEITLLTSNYDAQFGSTSSAVTTAITKSGTDQWHGSGYEFMRNNALNSRQWGIPKRPTDLENDFGGTIGGPIKIPWLAWSGRKKTYAFANYEGFRIHGAVTAPIVTIPTIQERTGDFSDWKTSSGTLIPIYDPATTTQLPNGTFTRQQFMGCNGTTPNVICPSDPRLASSLAQGWLKYLPTPDLPGILNNYTPPKPPTGTVNADSTVFDLRVDHYVGSNDHFSVTVHYFGSFGNNVPILTPQIDSVQYRLPNYDFANRFNWDHTFRPNLVNNFNIGYNDIYSIIAVGDARYTSAVPSIPGAINNKLPPALSFDTYDGFGDNSTGATVRPATIANDRLTWVRGKHVLGMGAEWRALQDKEDTYSGPSAYSSALNSGLLGVVSGNAMASFLLGNVSSLSETFYTLPNDYIRQKYLAIYASDTYKVRPKLTLNYGLRWDVSSPTREKYNHFSFINPKVPNPDAGNLPGSLQFAGNYAGSASLGAPYPESIWYKGVAPRVGFAYSVTPKTVVRAGYGIFYQLLEYPGWTSGVSPGRDGFNSTDTFPASNGGLTPEGLLQDGFTGKNLGELPPFYTSGYDNGKYPGMYRAFAPGRPPYMQQWNLTVEHQFTNDFYITAAYVANKGSRLISAIAPINVLNPSLLSMGSKLYNTFQPGQTTLDGVSAPYAGWVQQMDSGACPPYVAQALLPYPQFCGTLSPNYGENAGNSTFHSFQFKGEKRFRRGFYMLTSYTWAKFISSGSDIQTGEGVGTGDISPFQRERNKALDAQDVPNTLSVAALYDLPFGKGKRWLSGAGSNVLDKIVGGWQWGTVFRIQGGLPFFIYSSSCNIPGQFAMGCLPGVIPGANPFAQSKGSFNPQLPLLNRSAFEEGSTGGAFSFYGGVGSRLESFRGFGYHNHDMTLQKTYSFTERLKLQFRAEFFNIWNWHVFSQGTTWGQGGAFFTDVSSPDFGGVTGSVTAPRNIQFAAKIIF